MKILVPNSFPLAIDVDVEVVEYDIRAEIPEEHRDADVFIVWGNKPAHLKVAAQQLADVRLVQTLMAGADAVLAAGFRTGATICNGVGLHDATVSEHTLALTLGLVRKIPMLEQAKADRRWAWEVSGRQELHTQPVTTLLGANVLVWGFGSIAKHLAPLLQGLGANVKGVARSAGEREGFEVIADDAIDAELAHTDVLIMILPSTEETTDALDMRKLSHLPKHAYVVNVGRGTTVDEEALVAALEEGMIAGAAIDVMKTEPLPEDSLLWAAPNLMISPHAAGGRPVGADELVNSQLRALVDGTELRNVVR